MWPLLAIAAVSAIAQYQNSEEAKKATSAERKKIADVYERMQAPNFDINTLTPKDYSVLKQFVPEAASYVKEANPTIVKETEDSQAGRAAQRDALNKLRDIATSGKDGAFDAKLRQAQQAGDMASQQREQSILQDENRRGLLGSGMALQAKLAGGANAMARAGDQGTQAAIESYRNQLAALRDSASLGGDMRSQDFSMQGKNADIINAYNQRSATGQNNYNQYRAGLANDAQRYNIGQAQGVADRNTAQANDYARYNQQRGDDNAQRNFQNQQTINLGNIGVMRDQIADNRANAQDRNNAIAGVGNAATSGYIYSDGQSRADARFDRQMANDSANRQAYAARNSKTTAGQDDNDIFGRTS